MGSVARDWFYTVCHQVSMTTSNHLRHRPPSTSWDPVNTKTTVNIAFVLNVDIVKQDITDTKQCCREQQTNLNYLCSKKLELN